MTMRTQVSGLLDDVARDTPVADVAPLLRQVIRPRADREDVYPDALARDDADPEPLEPGTWDEVAFAHVIGRISTDQYRELLEAVTGG